MESRHFAHKYSKPKHDLNILTQGFCTSLMITYIFRMVRNNNFYNLMFYIRFNTLHSVQEILVSP